MTRRVRRWPLRAPRCALARLLRLKFAPGRTRVLSTDLTVRWGKQAASHDRRADFQLRAGHVLSLHSRERPKGPWAAWGWRCPVRGPF